MIGADSPPKNYELKAVAVLSLCFGLVGLDRFIINPLFPVIAEELDLKYDDIGLISAALALTWGIAAILMGRLADRVGVKAVLVPSILAFSVLVGFTGLATGLGSLLLIRGLMGAAEGTFVPASIVATTRASKPSRIGLNVGIQHMAAALFGLGLAPILATQLLKVLPSWHWVFAIVALPGLIMAHFVSRVLPADPKPDPAAMSAPRRGAWREALSQRRVLTNALAMSCWLAIVTTLAALLPSYLTDHLGLNLDRMGIVLSGQGLGGVIGMIVVPGLGDRFGHRKVALAAIGLQVVGLGLFSQASGDIGLLFILLFAIGLTGAGVMAMTVGPLTGRAIDVSLASTATGIVAGAGEIVGGAVAPAAAGMLAAGLGIAVVPLFALFAAVIGFIALALGAGEPGQGRQAATTPAA
jgi:MFS family permease